jgi:hypothetical protein
LRPAFKKEVADIDADISLSLSRSVKFRLRSAGFAGPAAKLKIEGSYDLVLRGLGSHLELTGVSPEEFSAYYRLSGISFPQGRLNVVWDILYRDNLLKVACVAGSDGLVLKKDKFRLGLAGAGLNLSFSYNLKEKTPGYSAQLSLHKSQLFGLPLIDEIKDIEGDVKLNGLQLTAKALSANIMQLPVKIDFAIADIRNPSLNVSLTSGRLDLAQLKTILSKKFNLSFPAELQGQAKLALVLETKFPAQGNEPLVNGCLELGNARLFWNKTPFTIEGINGKLEFTRQQLKWRQVYLKYKDTLYRTSGTLTDFRTPAVEFDLSCPDLKLEAAIAWRDNLLKIDQAKGRYLNSDFSLSGEIQTRDINRPLAKLAGGLGLRLENLAKLLPDFRPQLEKIKPAGFLQLSLNLEGNLKDLKKCSLQAEVSSERVSLYGLNSTALNLGYSQQAGLCELVINQGSLYEGRLSGTATLNLNSPNLVYRLNAEIMGLRIEKLKQDTPAKDKDISGLLDLELKLSGFSHYLDKLSGSGAVSITDGKLWQMNLFKGLGEIIFVSDFANIVFSEGHASFVIRDKAVFSEDVKLKSLLADINGSCRIGFDSSLSGALDVHVNSENVPLSGTLKDIFTVVVGQAGKFGVIQLSGTLQQPELKFKAAVVDIFRSATDTIFGKGQK